MSDQSIPGAMDLAALARMHFFALTPEEQAAAIRRMRKSGMGLETIASATALSVEQIRRVLRGETPGD